MLNRALIEKKKRHDLKSKIPYSEKQPVSIKTIEEIKEEAKVNVGLMKNKMKLEVESKKLGRPRPIFTQLIAEIREDQYKRFMNRAKRLGQQMAESHLKLQPVNRYVNHLIMLFCSLWLLLLLL